MEKANVIDHKHAVVEKAYKILLDASMDNYATEDDAWIAISEAIGFLGEFLDD